MIKKLFFLSILLLETFNVLSQISILDSLKTSLGDRKQINTTTVQILTEAANVLRKQYLYDTATVLIDRALQIADSLEDEKGIAESHFVKGIIYQYTGWYKNAISSYRTALPFYLSRNDFMKIGTIYEVLGLNYHDLGELDSVLYFYDKAYTTYNSNGFTNRNHSILTNSGNVYADQGNVSKAIEYYQKSLEVLEPEDFGRFASAHMNIGTLFNDMKEYDKALEYYQKALALQKEMGDQSRIALCQYNIGMVYLSKNLPSEAFDLLLSATKIAEEQNDPEHHAQYTYGVGLALKDLGKIDDAISYLKEAIALQQKHELKKELSESLSSLSKLYLQIGNTNDALKLSQEALQIANDNELIIQQNLAHKNLSEIFRKLGDFHKAFGHLSQHKILSDSLLNKENIRKTTMLESQFQFDKEKQQIQAEQDQRDLAFKQDLQRREWLLYSALGLSALLIVIAILAVRSNRIKKKANILLAEKNENLKELRQIEKRLAEETLASKERELATMAMASHEKNVVLRDLEEKMSAIETQVGADMKGSFKDIKRTISDGYALDQSWDSFLHKFEAVHPNFFDQLKKRHQNLTVEDLKLGAYLKIGMSNKEIANVTHLTLGSVKSKINRLKKKLNMSAEDNIRDFMLQET